MLPIAACRWILTDNSLADQLHRNIEAYVDDVVV
jgi:hypothetical protein